MQRWAIDGFVLLSRYLQLAAVSARILLVCHCLSFDRSLFEGSTQQKQQTLETNDAEGVAYGLVLL